LDLLGRAKALRTETANRLTAADEALAVYDQAVIGPDRVQAGLDALKAMVGADVLVVPEFTPPAALAAGWEAARDASEDLIAHLTRDFPVDDWLHGVARVREMPRLWERAVMLGDGLRGQGGLLSDLPNWEEPQLVPIQLPFRPGDHWLGMEFAAGT